VNMGSAVLEDLAALKLTADRLTEVPVSLTCIAYALVRGRRGDPRGRRL